ncbi:MAG: hypothetical protein J07HX5_02053 [halophilic archaeon J07HX5]|nr:MAG: hypothetical protein J07HX5_02053 [halophilic archaeon J07HX5]
MGRLVTLSESALRPARCLAACWVRSGRLSDLGGVIVPAGAALLTVTVTGPGSSWASARAAGCSTDRAGSHDSLTDCAWSRRDQSN